MARDVRNVAPWAEVVPDAPYPMSGKEFDRWPEEPGWRYELIRGRLVRMLLPTPYHGLIVKRVVRALDTFVERHGLGVVLENVGFKLPNPGKPEEEITLGPDVAFVAKGRGPDPDTPEYSDDYWHLAPDLVVEVASKKSNQYRPEMEKKALEYLQAGSHEVWVLYPWWNELDIWWHGKLGPESQTLKVGQQIEGRDVLPGFTYPVARFFPALDTSEREARHADA